MAIWVGGDQAIFDKYKPVLDSFSDAARYIGPIGAGSVVKHDIPPGSVAAGVPAKPIRPLAEYRERTLAVASHIRDMPEAEKRALLEKRFWED